MPRFRLAVLALFAATLLACGSDDDSTSSSTQPYGDFVSPQYAGGRNWLCHPLAARNYCNDDLSATIVYADGTTELEPHVAATDPEIDCFYVYPTWSLDPTGNSDLEVADDEEGFVVVNQAARLNAVCRVFAPVYRQVTIPALSNPALRPDSQLAQQDVVDAFKHYIANDNRGRGFVLIGHSQGASRLRSLIQSEIEPDPFLRERMVSAILLGTTVAVPDDRPTGGAFDIFPPCSEPQQIGCIISWVSYRATAPAGSGDLFGNAGDGMRAICTNPVDLGNQPRRTTPYFPTRPEGLLAGAAAGRGPFADPATAPQITTPFYTMPDFLEVRCASNEGYEFLEVTVLADPDDPRADDIYGTLEAALPGWGLHIVDASIAMGDLVDLVERQAATFAR